MASNTYGSVLDICVLESVLDAGKAGFEVNVLKDATRLVNFEAGKEALEGMKGTGAKIVAG